MPEKRQRPLSPSQGEGQDYVPVKRSRLNGIKGDPSPGNDQILSPPYSDGGSASTDEVPDESSKFSPGAIMSMRLRNFQVATDSTFSFGPYLNLVLGTNGTGKSTIVNAIYLLFRGRLDAIDRKRYDEFIQHGCSHSTITAQLKGHPGERNPRISLSLERGHSAPGRALPKPQWSINGRLCTENEIDVFISAFHIQVNNLCQFLPQFRVAAFSGESAQQRLLSTERAIGYEGMVEDHLSISNAGEELSSLSKEMERLRYQSQAAEEKRALLSEKAKQLEIANEDKKRMEMLKNVVKVAQYEEAKTKEQELKDRLRSEEQALVDFDSEKGSITNTITAAEGQALELRKKLRDLIDEQNPLLEEHNRLLGNISSLRGKVKDSSTRLRQIKTDVDLAKAHYEKLDEELGTAKLAETELKKELNKTGADTERYQELKSRLVTLETEYVTLEAKARAAGDKRAAAKRNVPYMQNQLAKYQREIEALGSLDGKVRSSRKAREAVRGDNGNLERSVAFVQSLQDQFKMPVIMPAILSLDIADKDILPIFAEQMSLTHLLKFVCQTAEDQKLLTKLAAQNSLDVKNTFVSPESAGKLEQDRKFASQMKALGFTGVISDKFDGPEPVLRLMRSLGVNRVAYKNEVITQRERDHIKASSTGGRMEFADIQSFYRIQRSRYGNKYQTETIKALARDVPPWARFMLKTDNSEEISRLKALEKSTAERIETQMAESAALKEEEARIQELLEETLNTLRAVKAELGNEDQLRDRLKRCQRNVERAAEKIQVSKSTQERRGSQLEAAIVELDKNLNQYMEAFSQVPGSLLKRLKSFESEKTTLSAQATDASNEAKFLSKALVESRKPFEARINELKDELNRTKSAHADKLAEHDAAISWLRAHNNLREGRRLVATMSVTDIEIEMSRLHATVDLHAQRTESLSSVKANLEATEKECESLTNLLAQKEIRMGDITRGSEASRQNWESKLASLIKQVSDKYSELFSKLGCRGSVTIDKPDLVAVGTWGVDINLAFRPEEQVLSKLTKLRQSGGERAVATAIYLLALQGLATAPFRVLDEINQGMDEKNERMAMKFFVEMACQPSPLTGLAQQTFLISPKLLLELPVHPNLSITFIYGGPTLGNTDALLPTSKTKMLIELLRKETKRPERNLSI